MARLTGSNRNDVFSAGAGQLQSLQLRAGRGYDTLRVTGSSDATVTTSATAQWRELEALDISAFRGNLNLSISPDLLASSNTQKLDLTVSETSHLTLTSATAGVVLHGSGHVQLANGSNSIITLASASVNVTGGTGADKITASSFGNRLDGGGGNDVLVGNGGADVFVHRQGSGADVIQNFNAALDWFDLTGHAPLNMWDLHKVMASSNGGTLISLESGSLFVAGVSPGAFSAANFQQNGAPLVAFGPVVVIDPGTPAATINSILAAVADGTTIVFADGVHILDAPLVLNRGNITVTGESAHGATLEFAFPAGTGGDFIAIGRGDKTYVTSAAGALASGSSTLMVVNGSSLHVGDAIYIYQPNTADYLLQNGWSNVSMDEAASRPFREFMTTITAIDGNTISLADAVPYDFAAGETRVFTADLLSGIALRDLTITSSLGEANAFSFTNTHAEFDGASSIAANGTSGLQLSNLTLTDNPSIGLTLSSSIHATIDGITVAGSHNKGSDGNGYGVLLTEAFNNTLTGVAVTDTRHAIVFSAWSAETGNSVSAEFINRDVNFHGSPDTGNIVHVAQGVLSYDTAIDPAVWSLVSTGGSNHAATDIWGRNAVRFAIGEGSSNVDTIYGADGGSYLNGHGSNDTLVGGSGGDVIIGGLRRDMITGGDGRDTFIFKMGDDLDTLTDMTFGAGGDTIVIMGNAAVDSLQDLVFTQDGADLRVRYGSNSTIILKDTVIADVDAGNFVFDPFSTTYADDWNGGL